MLVSCQQQDSQKIAQGIPAHGLQMVRQRVKKAYGDWVDLTCGCHLPVGYLPTHERALLDAADL